MVCAPLRQRYGKILLAYVVCNFGCKTHITYQYTGRHLDASPRKIKKRGKPLIHNPKGAKTANPQLIKTH